MIDYVFIGATPCEEECAQVGEEDYGPRSRKECRVYVEQIRRHFAAKGVQIPDGMLVIKRESHDFGSYLEVACRVDGSAEDAEAQYDLAYRIEAEGPTTWDDEAKAQLG